VLDAEEIARESVVDARRVDLKFEKCHIDPSIKGKTDQFMLKFRKPAH